MRTAIQQTNSDVADRVLKNNERVHAILTQTQWIVTVNPPTEVREVLALLKDNDIAVLSLDRGEGHITVGILGQGN
jgi:hypothetical protein